MRKLFVAVVALSLGGCVRQNVSADRAQLDPITVRIATPKHIRVPAEVMVSGTVETLSAPTSVGFLVSGKVIHVGPREADSVNAGEVIAVVDPADFQCAVEAAIAESALARAQNEQTRSGGYPQVHRRVLQPSAVVTDLWQTSQISGLRILALRIRRHTPRLLKSAGASRCGHLECFCSFGSSTATCFRERLIEFVSVL